MCFHSNTFLILFNIIFLNSPSRKGDCHDAAKTCRHHRPDRLGQDRARRGARAAPGRRGRLGRLDADLPRHGHRHGQAHAGGNAGRAAPHDRHRRPDGELLRLALRGGSDRLRGRYPRARKTADRRRRDGALHRLTHRRAHLCRRHGRHRAAAGAERALRRDRRRGSARRAAQI